HMFRASGTFASWLALLYLKRRIQDQTSDETMAGKAKTPPACTTVVALDRSGSYPANTSLGIHGSSSSGYSNNATDTMSARPTTTRTSFTTGGRTRAEIHISTTSPSSASHVSGSATMV